MSGPGPASYELREVTAGDVPEVVELVRQTLAEFGIAFGLGSETDAQVLGLPGSYTEGGGAFWVARGAGGELLGTCGVFPLDAERVELRKMYLLPAARGLGLGRALLARAVAFARARRARHLVLDTTAAMKRAIAFYQAHGFVRDDAQIRGARCNLGYRLDL